MQIDCAGQLVRASLQEAPEGHDAGPHEQGG